MPDGLQSKLVAAIPARSAAPARAAPAIARWATATGALAAAALMALLFLPQGDKASVVQKPQATTDRSTASNTSPFTDHNPQETDPCNILPPLGDWR